VNGTGFDIGDFRCQVESWGAVVGAIDGKHASPGDAGSDSRYLRGVLAAAAALIVERAAAAGLAGSDGWPAKTEADWDLFALGRAGRAALAHVVGDFDPALDCGARTSALDGAAAAAEGVVAKYAALSVRAVAATQGGRAP
jgi:hypothetical protein